MFDDSNTKLQIPKIKNPVYFYICIICFKYLFNKFLRPEKASEVEELPGRQTEENTY